MIDFLKQHKPLVVVICAALLVFILFVVLRPRTQPAPSNNAPVPTITLVPIYEPGSEGELLQQTRADENVTNIQNSILQQYPWYLKLPLKEKSYFVDFDPQKKTFIALLYPQKSLELSIDEQATIMKKEIMISLVNWGVDTSSYIFDWRITLE